MIEVKGRLSDIKQDYVNRVTRLEFTTEGLNMETFEPMHNKDLRIGLKEWKEGRSKSANSYFHALSDKLADHMRWSKPKMKNYLLFNYGQKMRDKDGNLVVIKTNANEEELISRSDIHIWYIKDSVDGTPMYVLLEHTQFFDSKEMAILIDGVIAECKAVGIPTDTPDQIAKWKSMWGLL